MTLAVPFRPATDQSSIPFSLSRTVPRTIAVGIGVVVVTVTTRIGGYVSAHEGNGGGHDSHFTIEVDAWLDLLSMMLISFSGW
jgi:hypothetical protein